MSIRICSDGLSFCVYSPNDDTPYTYKPLPPRPVVSLAANLKEALMSEPILKEKYQRVNVLISTPSFTTIPTVAFNRDVVDDVYGFLFPDHANTHVSYNVLRRSGIAIVFGMDKNVYKLILDDFPHARFYASASTLIEFFSDQSSGIPQKKMYVYIHNKEMSVFCFHEGRMLFVNTYPVNGVNDCQYYIMGLWEQFGFDQLEDHIEIVEEGRMSQLLSEKIPYFIKNVRLLDRSADFRQRVTSGHTDIPYDLQTLLVCGF